MRGVSFDSNFGHRNIYFFFIYLTGLSLKLILNYSTRVFGSDVLDSQVERANLCRAAAAISFYWILELWRFRIIRHLFSDQMCWTVKSKELTYAGLLPLSPFIGFWNFGDSFFFKSKKDRCSSFAKARRRKRRR